MSKRDSVSLKWIRRKLFIVVSLLILSACNNSEIGSESYPGIYLSTASSSVSATSATIPSGNSTPVKVLLVDQNSAAFITHIHTITLQASGGTSTGAFGAVTNNGDGTYSSAFTGIDSGTPTTITAFVDGQPIAQTTRIAVIAGNYSLSNSTLALSSGTDVSGAPITATLTVMDNAGDPISSGGMTVVFSNSGGTSTGTWSATTDHGNGTYSATFTGVTAGTATAVSASIMGHAITSAHPAETVTAGAIHLLAFTTPETVPTTTDAMQTLAVSARDLNSNLISTDSFSTVTLTPYASTNCSGSALGASLSSTTATLSSGVATFSNFEVYKTSVRSIKANIGGTTTCSGTLMIQPGTLDSIAFTTAPATPVTTDATHTTIVTEYDANGNIITTDSTSSIALAAYASTDCSGSSTASALSSSTATTSSGVGTFTNLGILKTSIQSIKASIGTTVTCSGALTVNPGTVHSIAFTTPPTTPVTTDETHTAVVTEYDANANAITTDSTSSIALAAYASTDCSGSSTASALSSSSATASSGVGTFTNLEILKTSIRSIKASIGTTVTCSATLTVTPGALHSIAFTTAPSTTGDTDHALSTQPVVSGEDAAGNVVSTYSSSVTLSAWSGTNCTGSITGGLSATTNPVSASSGASAFAGLTILKTNVQSISASDGTLTKCFGTLAISPGAIASIAFTTQPAPLSTDADTGLTTQPVISAYDANANLVTTDSTSSVSLTANDTAGCGGSTVTGGLSGTVSKTLSSGVATFTNVKPVKVSAQGILATLSGKTACSSTLSIAAGAISAANSTVSASPSSVNADDSATTTITVTAMDANSNLITGKTVSLASNRSTPDNLASSSGTTNGSGVVTFTATSTYPGTSTYTATGTSGSITITQTAAVTYNAAGVQALSAYGSSVWKTTGGTPGQGVVDSMIYSPQGTYVDASNYLYVTDMGVGTPRVLKFDSNGSFIGWIGLIRQLPTGGTYCGSPAVNSGTPGWCTGGFAYSGTGNNQFQNPTGITGDGTYLYIADNTRIVKVTALTGAFVGWIGTVNSTSGLGGATGCSTTAVGAFTPGWCTGGNAKTGTGDGMLNTPQQIATDGTSLYVADNSNHRINKYDTSSGAFLGWIGRVNSTTSLTQATGQTNTCSATLTGNATPGWCSGGTSQSGTIDGTFNSPVGVTYISPYIYVGDGSNFRISRFNAGTGAYGGWIGHVSSISGIGGAGTCSSTTVGSYTPNWCTGGAASLAMAGFGATKFLGNDSTDLYISDYGQNRVAKVDPSSGSFIGWVGGVSSTSGISGCTSPVVGQVTPGWCTGGAYQGNSSIEGTGYSITGAMISGGVLYATDAKGGKIILYNASTGAYQSWIGTSITKTISRWANNVSATVPVSGGFFVDDALYQPMNIYNDGTDLFTVDYGIDAKIKKFSLQNGTFEGWSGFLGNGLSTLGGGTGCSSAVNGLQTPNWCTGGTSAWGAASGQAQQPTGIAGDSTYIYTVDNSLNRINRYKKSDNTFQGWLGSVASISGIGMCSGASVNAYTPSWCTGGSSQSGTGDGMLNTPFGVYADGTYLYVADSSNRRVSKYAASNGQFIGWIGDVNSTTGLAQGVGMSNTCGATSTGVAAPGWCVGGSAQTGSSPGMFSTARTVTGDGTYIYVVDSGTNRVDKIVASTGAYFGWIGKVNNTTGLASASGLTNTCATTALGNAAPGWCVGGNTTSGTGDGMMTSPTGAVYSSGYLYVLDSSQNGRVLKFDATSGAFIGWRGNIATSPTGGDTGCSGATAGTVTLGWCKGGTASISVDTVGKIASGYGITVDTNYVYVGDQITGRITRMPK